MGGESAGLDRDAPTQDHTPAPTSTPEGATPELGRHELHEEIGRGGMGVVYRAHDLILNRPVALKMIVPRQGLLETPEAVQRFYREARAAARLRHPHIIPIHGMGLHQGRHCFTMPLLTGGSLAGRKGDRHQDARAAAALVEKIARAVQYAHEQGVIHRDLKPANILLDEHGEPVVADFGLAKVLDGDADGSLAGQRVGTPAYMSPEQAAGHTWEVSPRSDVWALGVILYELLTGKRPFPDPTPEGIYKQVLTGQPAAPRTHRGNLPPELEQIVLKCLQKDPGQRYAAAGEMAGDLARWLRGEPVKPATAPAEGRIAAAPPRRRRRILIGLAAAFVLVGLAAGLLWFYSDADRPLREEQARFRSGKPVQLIGATGKPNWSRWLSGGKDAQAIVQNDGVFAISAFGAEGAAALLELFPDTCRQSRYAIQAEIRHEKSVEHGVVGLYFAGSTAQTPGGSALSFLEVDFNDLQDVVDQYNRLPPELKRLAVPPKANRVTIASGCVVRDKANKELSTAFLQPELFKPAGNSGAPGQWRTVRIIVTPARIRAFWDGALVGEVDPAKVEKINERIMDAKRRAAPDDAALEALPAAPHLQGSLGLYIFMGYASFRNVRVEPLGGDDPN